MSVETACVLTGDIVRSSALGSERLAAVFDALSGAGEAIAGWTPATGPERFRGDGWQFVVDERAHALRAALCLRAAVRAVDADAETRIAIGFGTVRYGAGLADSGGEAFERSGRGLDALRTHRRLALVGVFDADPERALADGLVVACDALSQRWTSRQAEVVARMLTPDAPTLKSVAAAFGVTPQTVQAHFARAGGPALIEAVEAFERAAALQQP